MISGRARRVLGRILRRPRRVQWLIGLAGGGLVAGLISSLLTRTPPEAPAASAAPNGADGVPLPAIRRPEARR